MFLKCKRTQKDPSAHGPLRSFLLFANTESLPSTATWNYIPFHLQMLATCKCIYTVSQLPCTKFIKKKKEAIYVDETNCTLCAATLVLVVINLFIAIPMADRSIFKCFRTDLKTSILIVYSTLPVA